MNKSARYEVKTGVTMVMVAIFATLLVQHPAHAYLDPGTGSYTAQMLFAGLLVGAFSLRSFMRRVWDSVTSHFKKTSQVK